MTFQPPRDSGQLDSLAEIQAWEDQGLDEHGQKMGQWVTLETVYVLRQGLSGRNLEIARQLFATASHNIVLEYTPNVTRSIRFRIGHAVYAVGWVDSHGETWLRCTCEESWPTDLVHAFLMTEDGSYLLLEDGARIRLEGFDVPEVVDLRKQCLTEDGFPLAFEDQGAWLLEDDATSARYR